MESPNSETTADRQAPAGRLPWNGIILDLALFLWAGVLSFTAPWIRMHLRRIFNWVWLLHALTFYSVTLGFVLAAPPPPKKFTFNRVVIFVLIAGFISIYAPIWMFATPLAARSGGIGVGFVLRGMSISYIPFRLLMILTPPQSAFEIMTASISFGWFLLILTGVISW